MPLWTRDVLGSRWVRWPHDGINGLIFNMRTKRIRVVHLWGPMYEMTTPNGTVVRFELSTTDPVQRAEQPQAQPQPQPEQGR